MTARGNCSHRGRTILRGSPILTLKYNSSFGITGDQIRRLISKNCAGLTVEYWQNKTVTTGLNAERHRVSGPGRSNLYACSAVGGTKLCPFGFSGTRSGTGFGSGFGSGGFLQPDKSMANVNTNDTTNGRLVWLISGRDCSSKGYRGQLYNRCHFLR
jgi:hypothetical protein